MTERQERQWCAYVRVSKVNGRDDGSGTFHSPDSQLEAITRAVGSPAEVFTELDVSGRTMERRRLDAALAWVREDPTRRGLAAYDYSRLARNVRGFLALIDTLADDGSAVVSVMENIDTSSPEGRHMATVFASGHEYFSRVMGRRWRDTQARRRAAGLVANGNSKFGYLRAEKGQAALVSPVEGPLLREAYERYLAGAGVASIAKTWNDLDIPTRRGGANGWSDNTVQRILDSGFGAGKIRSKGQYLPGAHEPVISEETWEAYLRERKRRRGLHPAQVHSRYFLGGMVFCGQCGGRMHMSSTNPSVKQHQLRCDRYVKHRNCPGTWIEAHRVESALTWWLGAHLPDLLAAAREAQRDSDLGTRIPALRSRVRDLEAQLGRLAKGWSSGLLDDAGYRVARAEVERDLADERSALDSALDEQRRAIPEDEDEFTVLLQHPDNVDEWRTTLRKVVGRIVVTPDSIIIEDVLGQATVTPRKQ